MKLKVGTRRSPLALAQTRSTVAELEATGAVTCEIVEIKTTGDRILDRPLREIGGKGLFVKELDEALLDGRIDCAVHSLKDIPTDLPTGIVLAAFPHRADPRDALFTLNGGDLSDLPEGAQVGTTSLRRQAQALAARPDLRIVPLRGNVQTRLSKLETGECDGVFLACAGIDRLGLNPAPAQMTALDPTSFLPAVAQGALAITVCADAPQVAYAVSSLDHASSRVVVGAERACARVFGGGCDLPLGVYGRVIDDRIELAALVAEPDGGRVIHRELSGAASNAEVLGERLAEAILEAGGRDIIDGLGANQ